MQATSRLCSALTLLYVIGLVCGAGQQFANNWIALEDDFNRASRDMSRLSITNPIDVLRQQALIQGYRRQIQERERQIADNRALLSQIGKRDVPRISITRSNDYHNFFHHLPTQFEPFAPVPFLDFLQQTGYNTLEKDLGFLNTRAKQDYVYGNSIDEANNHIVPNFSNTQQQDQQRNMDTDKNNFGEGGGANAPNSRPHYRYGHSFTMK